MASHGVFFNNSKFFENIGQSLPIRRSFRNWLSEKLLLEDKDIIIFIEEAIESKNIRHFWKDEIFVSILLSDYSRTFFDIFANELLANDQKLLRRITFIIRIACKEIDDDFLKQLNIKIPDLLTLKYVLTKPRGSGWGNLIEFVFDNIDLIGISNINFVLPIIYGSAEIKPELIKIFDEIIQNDWKYYRDPYYDLSITIISKMESYSLYSVLPKYVLRIANLFCTYTPRKDLDFHDTNIGVEQYFGLEDRSTEYFPSSAFQTPIYGLLKTSFRETIDFIIDFTNKAIEHYANSSFDNSIHNVEVVFEKGKKKQTISNCLWNMYRGTGAPISPYLLQSIHMALEKFLLEIGKELNSNYLENWLLYFLKNSKSASISAVVASIVLAYPDKTFNVARVLFNSKEFFLYDKGRYIADLRDKSFYSFGIGFNPNNEIYHNERIKSYEDKHRKRALEDIFLQYQFIRNEETSDEDSMERQKILWGILDNYYLELPNESEQTEADKTWRLYLARMDSRKMSLTTEEVDDGMVIHFNPEIEPDLKAYSENSLSKSSKSVKFLPLKLWAEFRFNNDENISNITNTRKIQHLLLVK